jgi:hypothetical protein
MKNSGWFHFIILAVLAAALLAALALGARQTAQFAQFLRQLATPTPVPTPKPFVIEPARLGLRLLV